MADSPMEKVISWHSDEYPLLTIDYHALYRVASTALPSSHGEVIKHSGLERGAFHEVCVLHFADGWKAVARFKRNREQSLAYAESEYATMAYVRRHTTLPVPEIYLVNHDAQNEVGAAYAIMEYMPGRELFDLCHDLSLESKKAVVKQWAEIVVQLSRFKFESVGPLTKGGHGLGPVQSKNYGDASAGRGPFASFEEYVYDLMGIYTTDNQHLNDACGEVKREIRKFFLKGDKTEAVEAPFRLMHGDLKVQNILFHYDEKHPEIPPKLSGVVDWDGSCAFPIYYLFELPDFIRDVSSREDLHADNKLLRELFEQTIIHGVDEEDKETAKSAFKKHLLLERVLEVFPWQWKEDVDQAREVNSFLEQLRNEEAYEWQEGKEPMATS